MRVLVIGTSHSGAVKQARREIAFRWPDIELTFFGLPGGHFDASKMHSDGMFRATEKAERMSKLINGTTFVDITKFDHVFVVSHSFSVRRFLGLFTHYDVVEWPTRRILPLISGSYLADLLDAFEAEFAADIRRQFPELENITVAAAPFPAASVSTIGDNFETLFHNIAQHPEAQTAFDLFGEMQGNAARRAKVGLIKQPPRTVHAPFLTKEEFAHGAKDFHDPDRPASDKRHMNAKYGLALFEAFVESL